ncbi:MAG: RagB/SusD family nutrient uptake outer membrane protein, partial [Butyricimonas faecihominis]
MKKILGIFCITLLLGSCSSFLEEYSQDLSKVESYTDLDEVLLGEAYLPVGRIWSANSMLQVENKYFQTAHYMSDELTVFSWDDRGDINGVQDEMFGWHTWQQDVGLNAEGSSRNAEDEDWNKAYHCINICNMVIDAIDEQHAANEEQKLEKSRIKGEAHFLRALYYFTLVN